MPWQAKGYSISWYRLSFQAVPAPSASGLWGGGAQNVPLTILWYYISPLPPPSPPLLKGGEGRGEGGSRTHVPCPFGALLVTLYQFFSEGFLNGERDIGGGASQR